MAWCIFLYSFGVQAVDLPLVVSHASTAISLENFRSQLLKKLDEGKSISFVDIGNFLNVVPIPKKSFHLFEKIVIDSPVFTNKAEGYRKGFTIEGKARFDDVQVSIQVVVVDLIQGPIDPYAGQIIGIDHSKYNQEAMIKEIVQKIAAKVDSKKHEVPRDLPAPSSPVSATQKTQKEPEPKIDQESSAVSPAGRTFDLQEVSFDLLEQGTLGITVYINLPKNWKLSKLSSLFDKLDSIELPSGKFIITSFDHKDPYSYALLKKGLNFVSAVDLIGPLNFIQEFLNKISGYLVAQGTGKARFEGHIDPGNMADSQLSIILPIRLGVDFEEMYKKGKIKKEPKFLRRVALGDFVFAIQLTPPTGILKGLVPVADFSVMATAGVVFNFVTQADPVELRAGFLLSPQEAQIAGQMIGLLEPAFGISWLSIGNFGTTLGINFATAPAMLAATGVPFNLLELHGGLALGTGQTRSSGQIKAVVKFNLERPPDILFDGKIDKIDILALALKLGNIETMNIPKMVFTDLQLRLAPVAVKVMDMDYPSGITARGLFTLGSLSGLADVRVVMTKGKEKLIARGALTNIDTPFFKLMGKGLPGFERENYGAAIDITIDKKVQKFLVTGMVSIPPLRFEQQVDMALNADRLSCKFNTNIFGIYKADVDMYVPFAGKIGDFNAHIEIEKKQADAFKQELLTQLKQLKDNQLKSIERANETIARIQKEAINLKNSIDEELKAAKIVVVENQEMRQKELEAKKAAATSYERCKLLSPKTWFTECTRALWESIVIGVNTVQIEIDNLSEKAQYAGKQLKEKYVIGLKNLERQLAEAQAILSKVAISMIDVSSFIIENSGDFELRIVMDIDGGKLHGGMPVGRFIAQCSFPWRGEQRMIAIPEIELSQESIQKNTHLIKNQIPKIINTIIQGILTGDLAKSVSDTILQPSTTTPL